jgi:hypothetical protein
MASSYSADLKLELMVTGEKAGLWGDITNTNLTIVQQAIAGYEAVTVNATGTTALSFTNGATSDGKNAVIVLTGTITGNIDVTIPDSIEKNYLIKNGTTGAFTVTFKTVSGTGVTWAASEKTSKVIYSDGTNIVDSGVTDLASDYSPQLSADLDANGNNIIIDGGNSINDENDLEQIKFATTASAVNEFTVTNAATGNAPEISATGGDTNIDLNLTPKGIGRATFNGQGKIQSVAEKVTTEATAATGTVNYDVLTQAVWNFTTDASANWTLNVRGDGSNTLNSIMDTGESITIAHIVSQGGTAYYNNAFEIDGSSVTPEWQGGAAPDAGNANSLDTYTYTIIKTADATFTVLASQTQFA